MCQGLLRVLGSTHELSEGDSEISNAVRWVPLVGAVKTSRRQTRTKLPCSVPGPVPGALRMSDD